MKKFMILSTVFFLAITLVGCKEDCTNNASEGTLYEFDKNQVETTTITVWLDNESWSTELKTAFEAQYPDIKVKIERVGSVDTRAQLELLGESGSGADVVVFPHDHIGAALASNLLMPFPASLRASLEEKMVTSAIGTATSCYDPEQNKAVSCDGEAQSELFGAPLSGESVALFYNKTLLNEINGSTAPQATWEEIIASAATYNTYGAEDTKLYFAMDVGNAYDMHWAATAFGFELFGPAHLDETQANLGSQEMIDALTWLSGTVKPSLNLTSASLSGESNRTLFETGELAYIIDGPWSIERYADGAAENDFEFGVTKIPTVNGVQPVTFSGVQMAAVYKGTEKAAAAFKFVEFMTSDEGLAIMYATTNKLPALKDVSTVAGVSDDEYLSGISQQLVYSHPMPIIKEMGFFWSNAGSMYGDAWNETATPEDAAATAQNGFDGQAGLGD